MYRTHENGVEGTKTIDGIDLPTLSEAIQKICLSEGIPIKQLTEKAEMPRSLLADMRMGRRLPDEQVIAAVTALRDLTNFNIQTPKNVMEAAADIPAITYESTRKALLTIARHQNTSVSQLQREAREKFPPETMLGGQAYPTNEGLLSVYYVAKLLGFNSTSDLLKEAAQLPPDQPREQAAPKSLTPVTPPKPRAPDKPRERTTQAKPHAPVTPPKPREPKIPALDGIDPHTLGKAIEKIRISEGIETELLAHDAGLQETTLLNICHGKATPEKEIRDVITALDESTKLGLKTPADVIARANDIPRITRAAVDEAIIAVTRHRGMILAELQREVNRKFPTEVSNSQELKDEDSFIPAYYQAKALGCVSIGDLLKQAENLSPERKNANTQEQGSWAGRTAPRPQGRERE